MRELAIAYGSNRQAKKWVNKTTTFDALKERLKVTIRTPESAEEYAKMSKAQRDAAKDHGGFVAGALKGGRRKIGTVDFRSMVALDGDRIDKDFLENYEKNAVYTSVLYSTHSSTEDAPRVRLVFPCTRDMTPEEFVAVSRYVAQSLGIDFFDECSYQPNQLMYWPSTPQNGTYIYKETAGGWLDPDEILSAHPEWRDPTRLPTSSRESRANTTETRSVQDPLEKDGVVGLFNRVYFPVTKALDRFLADVYEPAANDRYHLIESSSIAGVEIKDAETLGKKAVAVLIGETDGDISDALSLRLQLAKSSVKKYTAMQNAACSDDRCRGMFQFYGANRTGRFAGRLVQLQNLPQNHMPDLAEARELIRSGNFDMVDILYDDVPDTLSQLIRTAFIPAAGKKFYVADFSAIEARVIAWYAGEEWRSKVFSEGGDIYCASASQMFKVPVEKHGVNGHLRQKGKIAELALGYGGSVGALKAMGAIEMGLTEDELPGLVSAWRESNPHIVRFWWNVDAAVKRCIKERKPQEVKGIRFFWQSGMLFITLPSGRNLSYVKPCIGENRFGGESVTYEGVGGTKKWERIESYGPKFVENIVQATSRDILVNSMKTLRNCSIVAHVHDELIIECDPSVSLEAVCEQMGRVPKWADGLLLRADGYVCDFYQKD